ncbi:MAG: TetR/AcrR family transcriptional regulator C-terminal domain-containing protein [Myxococcaceae bacterium]
MQPSTTPRAKTIRRREPLNPERIARAALELIDETGLEEFSTRRLGKVLGVEGMALYKHFESREALLDAVSELLISSIIIPKKGSGWAERVRIFARQYRSIARMHPKAYPLLAMRRLGTEKSLMLIDDVFAALLEEGFEAQEAAFLFRTVGNYCNGTALDELAIMAQLQTGAPRVIPHGEVDAFLHPAYFDTQFEAGLDLILDGFARRRARRKES